MTAQEQAVVVEALKDLEQVIVDGIGAEIAKITGPYAPLVAAVEASVMPQIKTAIDGFIAAKFPPVAP